MYILYIYIYTRIVYCFAFVILTLALAHPIQSWVAGAPGFQDWSFIHAGGLQGEANIFSSRPEPCALRVGRRSMESLPEKHEVRDGQIWSDYVRLKLDIWSTWRFWSLSWLADLRMNNIWTSAFRIAPEAHRKTQQLSSPGSWSCIVLPKWGEATPLYHVPRMCRTLSGPPEASSAENLGQLRILSRFNGYRLSSIFSWPWWRGRKKGGLTFTFRFANSIITAPENHSAGKRHHHHDRQRSSWKLKNHSC